MKKSSMLCLFLLFTLCVLEGLSSTFLAFYDSGPRPYAERVSTHHDPEIGWIGRTNFNRPDFYGPDRGLSTDEHGFRKAFTNPDPDRPVIAISGDSFALGYGVDDDDSWAAWLGRRLDTTTINLGQGGYGPGQAWLWYRRHEEHFKHDLLLFTLILPDLDRFALAHYNAPKPKLELEDHKLVVANSPVPRPSSTSWLQKMAFARFIRRGSQGPRPNLDRPDIHNELAPIFAAVLDDLRRRTIDKQRNLVIVLLPWKGDNTHWRGDDWSSRIQMLCATRGIPYWNLGDEFNNMKVADLEGFFIQPGELDYPGAAGHYTAEGNSRVASWMARRIQTLKMKPH